MLVCRCCLTFEDNLYPFAEYKVAFRECTGLKVESTAMICPGCIRKLNEAHAFREVSIKSDDFLRQQKESGIIVKSEPADHDDDFFQDDTDAQFHEFEPVIKVEEKPNVQQDLDFAWDLVNPEFESVLLHDSIRKRGRKKKSERKKSPKLETPQSMQNSMRAKMGWSQGCRENLIKECPYCFMGGLKKSDLKKHIQEHIGE